MPTATIGALAGAASGIGAVASTIGALSGGPSLPKAPPVLAMPDPNDPALLNSQRTQLALVQGRSGRQSTNLSSPSGGTYQSTTAGGG